MAQVYIASLDQLKKEAYRKNGDFVHFQVILAGGLAISSKRISFRPEENEFLIITEIDESYQKLSDYELSENTLLIESISKNCLIKSGID